MCHISFQLSCAIFLFPDLLILLVFYPFPLTVQSLDILYSQQSNPEELVSPPVSKPCALLVSPLQVSSKAALFSFLTPEGWFLCGLRAACPFCAGPAFPRKFPSAKQIEPFLPAPGYYAHNEPLNDWPCIWNR